MLAFVRPKMRADPDDAAFNWNQYLVKSKAANTLRTPALPPLLEQVRGNAASVLCNWLEELFVDCDDVFFDLADGAGNNRDQNAHFDALRELRLKKTDVVADFKVHFEQGFERMLEGPSSEIQDVDVVVTEEDLSLVGNEELEEAVAMKDMVRKSRDKYQELLHELSYRIDYLLGNVAVTDDTNPIDPQQLALSFSEACTNMDMPIETRIILYKQFDRAVLAKMDRVLEAANQLLIDSGVLPHLRIASTKKAASANGAAANDESAIADALDIDEDSAQHASQTRELMGELQGLMHRFGEQRPEGVLNLGSYNKGPILSRIKLIQTLSNMQLQPGLADEAGQLPTGLAAMEGEAAPGNALYDTVKAIFQKRKEAGQPASLHSADEDTINLVSMFFDFILDDDSLPIAMQALISRLQIPVLKVSLRDNNFFADVSHPFRRLLNELSKASYGREGKQAHDEAFFELASDIVQDVLDDEELSADFLAGQLETLLGFSDQEVKKSETIEKRTNEAAQAQAVTNHTRAKISTILQERIEGKKLPRAITSFLSKDWQNVMFLAHLKYGEKSRESLETLQIADDLIWSVQLHNDEKSRNRLEKMRDSLCDSIAEHLQDYLPTYAEADEVLEDIRRTHSLIAEGRYDEIETESAENTLQDLVEAGVIEETHDPETWKNMTALERQQAHQESLNREFVKLVESLSVGTWLVFRETPEKAECRCKVSALLEEDDSILFVNRFGSKVEQKSRRELTLDLQHARARILEDKPLIDRAVSKITESLRKSDAG